VIRCAKEKTACGKKKKTYRTARPFPWGTTGGTAENTKTGRMFDKPTELGRGQRGKKGPGRAKHLAKLWASAKSETKIKPPQTRRGLLSEGKFQQRLPFNFEVTEMGRAVYGLKESSERCTGFKGEDIWVAEGPPIGGENNSLGRGQMVKRKKNRSKK